MNAKLPKVLILTTGGTIATRVDQPMVSGNDLVQALPQLTYFATIEVLEFSRIGSFQMTPATWLDLAKKIDIILRDDSDLAGIVITHGTDTIEETAFFLQLTLKDKRPVVLTGAMKTTDEISADGPANLINAVRVAANGQSKDQGVLMVFNERILSAQDAWKSDNRAPETFLHTGFGFLGIVDPGGIKYYRKLAHRYIDFVDIDIQRVSSLPQVEIVTDFTGFDPSILKYFASRDLDGLIFQSMAGGRLSQGAEKGIKLLTDKITVVVSSKLPMGRILGSPNSDLPVIYARELSSTKARILLMLGLLKNWDFARLESIF